MFGPYLALEVPPSSFFTFPPKPHTPALPPSSPESSFKSPFPISAKTYNRALNGKLPLIFAATYIFCAFTVNQINRRRGYKPYAISKTAAFRYFVLIHNALLALYSGITCAAMVRALNVSLSGSMEKYGLPGAVDALCKIQGPRGYGDAIMYNATSSSYASRNSLIHLGADMLTPDSSDVGRIWNEGLAFWGWFFYLSKFYEVVDTMIILTKGKRSSTLQTYHHAGAMLCMWAGMRYMSPPIWMFALVNSGIHTMMYSYYTITGLGYRVSGTIKRTLTTMQILQFLVGASFAAIHLFVSYSIPVAVPYTFTALATSLPSVVSEAAASITSMAGKIDPTSSLSSLAAEATSDGGAWLKKLIYRAGGSPALAENVRNHNRQTFGDSLRQQPLVNSELKQEIQEIRYHNEWHEVHCLDTDGQAFAIWLNVVYLLPLTFLFLRFFWKSYIVGKPPTGRGKGTNKPRQLSESLREAAAQTSEAVEEFGEQVEKDLDVVGEEVEKTGNKVNKKVHENNWDEKAKKLKEEMEDMMKGLVGNKDAGEKVEEQESKVSQQVDDVADDVKRGVKQTSKKVKQGGEQVQDLVEEVVDTADEEVQQDTRALKNQTKSLKESTEGLKSSTETLKDSTESVKSEVKDSTESVKSEGVQKQKVKAENAPPKPKTEDDDEPSYAEVVVEGDHESPATSAASTPSKSVFPSGKKHKSPKKKH